MTLRGVGVPEDADQHPAQLTMRRTAQDAGDLRLEGTDRGATGIRAPMPFVRQGDELGPSIGRIGRAFDVAEALELVDELPHRCMPGVGSYSLRADGARTR